jgi:transposase
MEYWQPETDFYCGVDLHWTNMYVCIVDRSGEKLVHRKLRNDPALFLKILKPYLPSITVATESTGSWYWLGDLCDDEGIRFTMGHALYMKAIHGAKSKNDRIDSEKIARLAQSGLLPRAYAYPKGLRAVRDLLRRRMIFSRRRAALMAHLKSLNAQANLPTLKDEAKVKSRRHVIPGRFTEDDVRLSAETDLEVIAHYDKTVADLERYVLARTKQTKRKEVAILMSSPGVGKTLALTIVLEIGDIDRFPTRQKFASYSRLVSCEHKSNGRRYGVGGKKIGNAYLRWAFAEVSVLCGLRNERMKGLRHRLESRYGIGKGKAVLAHKFGRAFYYMLKNGTVFDEEKFLKG